LVCDAAFDYTEPSSFIGDYAVLNEKVYVRVRRANIDRAKTWFFKLTSDRIGDVTPLMLNHYVEEELHGDFWRSTRAWNREPGNVSCYPEQEIRCPYQTMAVQIPNDVWDEADMILASHVIAPESFGEIGKNPSVLRRETGE
jgi:hypothetical protein